MNQFLFLFLMINIGVAGVPSSAKNFEEGIKWLSEHGLHEEVEFVRNVWMDKTKAVKYAELSKRLNVKLSVHAPYYVNLNSNKKETVRKSKFWIFRAAEIASLLGADRVVFHPGYYTKDNALENIKNEIINILDMMKEKNVKTKLAPETMGKINVFGSVDEILELSKIRGVEPCLDFAHIHARSNGCLKSIDDFVELLKKFKNHTNLHCHYTSVAYNNKGEKHHKAGLSDPPFKALVAAVKELNFKNMMIITESPIQEIDALKMKKVVEKEFTA